MDRLAQYIHWKDKQGFEQAVMVAKDHPVKLGVIRRWLEGEGHPDAFKEFAAWLKRPE